jgi:hypothetical protein
MNWPQIRQRRMLLKGTQFPLLQPLKRCQSEPVWCSDRSAQTEKCPTGFPDFMPSRSPVTRGSLRPRRVAISRQKSPLGRGLTWTALDERGMLIWSAMFSQCPYIIGGGGGS